MRTEAMGCPLPHWTPATWYDTGQVGGNEWPARLPVDGLQPLGRGAAPLQTYLPTRTVLTKITQGLGTATYTQETLNKRLPRECFTPNARRKGQSQVRP